jgi:hypothetical protein
LCVGCFKKSFAILTVQSRALEPGTRQHIWLHGLNLLISNAHQQICFSSAAAVSRRRGSDLGTTIKYLRKTTSGTAGISLDVPG